MEGYMVRMLVWIGVGDEDEEVEIATRMRRF